MTKYYPHEIEVRGASKEGEAQRASIVTDVPSCCKSVTDDNQRSPAMKRNEIPQTVSPVVWLYGEKYLSEYFIAVLDVSRHPALLR